MFVRDRMSTQPVTVGPETKFQDALRLMQDGRFRRLPVVDSAGRLLGIVSERDLLHASPSPATSLSMWELSYLLSRLTVAKLMSTKVITVGEDTPLEEAARLMVTHRIGGMPVVDANHVVVGVITETDIFKAFVEMMGTGQAGLRLMLRVPNGKGVLAKLTTAISELDGNILSVGTFGVAQNGDATLLIKVAGINQEQLVKTLESLGDHVLDVRMV